MAHDYQIDLRVPETIEGMIRARIDLRARLIQRLVVALGTVHFEIERDVDDLLLQRRVVLGCSGPQVLGDGRIEHGEAVWLEGSGFVLERIVRRHGDCWVQRI